MNSKNGIALSSLTAIDRGLLLKLNLSRNYLVFMDVPPSPGRNSPTDYFTSSFAGASGCVLEGGPIIALKSRPGTLGVSV